MQKQNYDTRMYIRSRHHMQGQIKDHNEDIEQRMNVYMLRCDVIQLAVSGHNGF